MISTRFGNGGRGRAQVTSRVSPHDERRGQVRPILLLVIGLGLALTAIALLLLQAHPSTGARVASGLVGAVAGALVGASISNFINSQYDRPILHEVRDLLVRTSECALTSPETALEHLRKRWHHYHLTIINGKPVWRYVQVPFDNHSAVGALTADAPEVNAIGSRPPRVYKTDAAVWDRRLVLLQTRVEGDEAAVVEIFPDVSGFQSVHAGVGVMQSWSGPDVLVPVLISDLPILPKQVEGTITDAAPMQVLEALWSEHFAHVRHLLPEAQRGAGSVNKQYGR